MFSIFFNILERVKSIFKSKEYDFSKPVPKSNKDFWKGVSCEIGNDLKCIIHLKSSLLISYEGKLLGRYINGEMIPLEELDPKIVQWYKDSGFEVEQV